jgi:Transposase, Mutator family
VVVTGITATGEREVLACAVGDTETEAFWTDTFRSLRGRGLAGVRLVVSDHHEGLKAAIAKCFVGTGERRTRQADRPPRGEARSTSPGVRLCAGDAAMSDLTPAPDEAGDSGRRECAGECRHVRHHVHGLAVRRKLGVGLGLAPVAGSATVDGSGLVGHERHARPLRPSDRRGVTVLAALG